jgi:hypothetical protein
MQAIPYLNRQFRYVDGGHHPGIAWVDLDNVGKPDLFIANQLKAIEPKKPEASDPDVEQSRAVAERARADVRVAEAELKQAQELFRLDTKSGKDRVEQARAKVAVAQATADAAELRLKEATVAAERRRIQQYATDPKALADDINRQLDRVLLKVWLNPTGPAPSDADFLRRVILDLTGSPPTTVEEKYFVADTDLKKREKLLGILLGKSDKPTGRDKWIDDLLADPEVQKRWAELQQQRLYTEHLRAAREAWVQKKPADRLDRLLADLFEKKKSDEQMLNALCLATLARYPTETEQRLILDAVKGQTDRQSAWQGVLKALAATEEARAHAAELGKRGGK